MEARNREVPNDIPECLNELALMFYGLLIITGNWRSRLLILLGD